MLSAAGKAIYTKESEDSREESEEVERNLVMTVRSSHQWYSYQCFISNVKLRRSATLFSSIR